MQPAHRVSEPRALLPQPAPCLHQSPGDALRSQNKAAGIASCDRVLPVKSRRAGSQGNREESRPSRPARMAATAVAAATFSGQARTLGILARISTDLSIGSSCQVLRLRHQIARGSSATPESGQIVVGKRPGDGLEPEAAREARVVPVSSRVHGSAKTAPMRDLDRAPVQRVRAARRQQHGVHAERGARSEDGADVRVVDDVLEQRRPGARRRARRRRSAAAGAASRPAPPGARGSRSPARPAASATT